MSIKNHFLRFALEHKGTFDSIRDGSKRIETRAATVKYKDIKVGDTLTLSCGEERFVKRVKRTQHFRSLRELFDVYKPEEIKPGVKTEKEMTKIYHSFPNYEEKIGEFGIFAFELED